MAGIAVIGENVRVQGFGLAGARVLAAEDAASVRAAWDTLANDVALVILTPSAAATLHDAAATSSRQTVVLPS